MNLLPAKVSGSRAFVDGAEFQLGAAYAGLPQDGRVQVGVRPEYVTLTAGAGLPVQVRRIADLGRKRLAYVNLGAHPMVASVPLDMANIGDNVNVSINPAHTHVYVADIRVQGAAA